jgi:hypothetical protein
LGIGNYSEQGFAYMGKLCRWWPTCCAAHRKVHVKVVHADRIGSPVGVY